MQVEVEGSKGGYGLHELSFATPFADRLVSDAAFREWVLCRTKFSNLAVGSRVLDQEMLKRRSPSAGSWWRSHYTAACNCSGCGGQETDLLAIFEALSGARFALHVEVKHPGDGFKADGRQARAYGERARCWVMKPPRAVLPHQDAATMLLCSERRLADYGENVRLFDHLLTFEAVERSGAVEPFQRRTESRSAHASR